jgi:hypothetical protein
MLLDRKSYLIAVSVLGVVAAGSLGATVTLLAKHGQSSPYLDGGAGMLSETAISPNLAGNGSTVVQSTGIFINDHEISKEQADALGQMYGAAPPAGRYWYDARSGLYGYAGGKAVGYMRPGHDFGR